MKRLLALISAAVAVLTFTACSGAGQTAASSATSGGAQSSAFASDEVGRAGEKALVAFFSRADENYGVGVVEKGNTEIIAELIAEEVGADTFRIRTESGYPKSYDECTSVARSEKDSNARPKLAGAVEDFDTYDMIYLGFPIWYGDMPMAVYTFLESYDFSGKTIVPFCTHAGSGLADTVSSIRSECPTATVTDGLAVLGTTAQTDADVAKSAVHKFLSSR